MLTRMIGPSCRMPRSVPWHLRVTPRLRVQHPSAREDAREKRTQRLGGTQRQPRGFASDVGMGRLSSPPLIRWLREASSRPLGLRGLWVPPFRRRGWNAEVARNAEATPTLRGGGWRLGRENKSGSHDRPVLPHAAKRRVAPPRCAETPRSTLQRAGGRALPMVSGEKNAKAARTQRRMSPLRASCGSRPSSPSNPRGRESLCVRPGLCVPPSPADGPSALRQVSFVVFVASCEIPCGVVSAPAAVIPP